MDSRRNYRIVMPVKTGIQCIEPKNRSCLYVQCVKSDLVRAASQLNPVT